MSDEIAPFPRRWRLASPELQDQACYRREEHLVVSMFDELRVLGRQEEQRVLCPQVYQVPGFAVAKDVRPPCCFRLTDFE